MLNKNDTPALVKDKDGTDLPIDSINGTDKTAYLNIDLGITPSSGQSAATNMTAVFAPDPQQLSGSAIDVLLYFHGHKTGSLENLALTGFTARDYLTRLNHFKLRDFILKTSKKKFVLVFPTLGDTSQAGLLFESSKDAKGQAEAFVQQALNGVKKYFGTKTATIGSITMAAHSGGGAILGALTNFSGIFANNVHEIWCLDCLYNGGSGQTFRDWADKPAHNHDRLFVFSTGQYAKFALPTRDTKKVKGVPPGPDNPAVGFGGTGANSKVVYDYAVRTGTRFVLVRINHISVQDNTQPDKERDTGPFTTPQFPYGNATEHNQCVGFYFDKLVSDSQNLK